MRGWKGPECHNDMRNRDLKQKLQSSKRIKDLGGRLPLCLRNERISSWTYRKTTDSMKFAKQKAGSYAASRKIKDWTLWRVRPPPPQNGKKLHIEEEHIRRERWQLLESDHHNRKKEPTRENTELERERERERETLQAQPAEEKEL
jgi:hypothetical protein